jgi:pectinesterase
VKDAEVIANYRKPSYVMGGWTPAMPPLILKAPASTSMKHGETVALEVVAAAVPEPAYQWSRNGKAIAGATSSTLTTNVDGTYVVSVKNASGVASSEGVRVRLDRR